MKVFLQQKIDSLTSTRAIAAFLVLLAHSWNYHFGKILHLPNVTGAVGVSFFFVLSGFIMCHTYNMASINYATFFRRRFARIIPVYWFSLIFTIFMMIVAGTFKTQNLGLQSILYITTLHSYLPQIPRLNSPSWSISAEVLFYLLFPAMHLIWQKNRKVFMVSTISIFILSQLIRYYYGYIHESKVNTTFAYVFPLLRLNEFMIGMAGYDLFKYRKSYPRLSFIYLPSLALVICGLFYEPLFKTSFYAPLFVLIIAGVAVNPPKILNYGPLIYLGEISYSIYILHTPIFMATNALLRSRTDALTNFCVSYAAVLIVAAMSYHFIEKPARNLINGRKKKTLQPQSVIE